MSTRVRTSPVHGAGPCAVFLTNYVRGGEGHVDVWQIAKHCACVHQPLLSVGLIARQRRGAVCAVGAAGQGMYQPPPPTICKNITAQ